MGDYFSLTSKLFNKLLYLVWKVYEKANLSIICLSSRAISASRLTVLMKSFKTARNSSLLIPTL